MVMKITILLMSLIMLVSATATAQRRDFTERDESNQTYQLAPGTHVEISSIRGNVEITNGNSAAAEVQIIRTARTREDLEHHKIEVQQTGDSLVIRGVQEREQSERNIQVNHHLILKLPRNIDLTVSSVSGSLKGADVDGPAEVTSISGSVTVGNVGGSLQVRSVSGNLEVGNVAADAKMHSISGNVRVSQVNGLLDVTSVSGSVKTTLVSLSPLGIHIRSVSGSIEIGFKSAVNADFSADSISGEVYLNIPNVTRENDENSHNVRARIGAGGTRITISSVSGDIRLTQS
jgi:DUF4097 and DUF4098 domain-containing protein YvlB